jgi:hypothetical protein
MTLDLFSKLPGIWKRLDIAVTDVINDKGFLERFLLAPQAKFESIEAFIAEYLRINNVEELRDSFVTLLVEITGHRWIDYRSRSWNRNRIQSSITRSSYKGTYLAISDLAYEHGSGFCNVVDMASVVAVWSRQGVPDEDNCYFFDSDFFHPGVFLIYLSETVDFEHFVDDFQYIKPAATKWHYYIQPDVVKESVQIECSTDLIIHMDCTPRSRIAVFNESLFNGGAGASALILDEVYFDNTDILWDSEEVLFDGTSLTYT